MKPRNEISLVQLPKDGVLLTIFSFLNKKSLVSLGLTCKFFQPLVNLPLTLITLKEKGLTETDIKNLNLFRNQNASRIKNPISKIYNLLRKQLHYYNFQLNFILECGDLTNNMKFSQLFNPTDKPQEVIPVSDHLATLWDKIESDFSKKRTSFFNDDGIFNNFSEKVDSKILNELCHYTMRHIILFALWLNMINGHENKNWDNIFPKIFPQLLQDKISLEQKILNITQGRQFRFLNDK